MDKSSEAWRAECEIRYIANLPDLKRTNFYQGALKHRGEVSAKLLVAAVNAYRKAEHERTRR